jgi:transposase
MATIVGHLSIAQLEQRVRAAADAVEAKHFQAIRLLAQGRTFVEVADILAFVPRWVEELAQRYNRHGPAALGNQRRNNGRSPSVLTPELLAAVAERVRTPPDDGGLWTGPKVAAWMAEFLGREKVHAQRGWEALKKIAWSIQAPRPRHPRTATPQQRDAFKKSSQTSSRKLPRNTRIGRSRSGRWTSIGSAFDRAVSAGGDLR